MSPLLEIVRRNQAGQRIGIAALRSTNRWVVRAALLEAARLGTLVLVEASACQVNPSGARAGMAPSQFADVVFGIADDVGLAREQVWLGVARLGPGGWPSDLSEVALAKCESLAASLVQAGFRVLDIDCSTSSFDDPVDLPDRQVAARTARLCQAAERAHASLPARARGAAPHYLLGGMPPADARGVDRRLDMHRDAFARRDLLDTAWPRVVAMAVDAGRAEGPRPSPGRFCREPGPAWAAHVPADATPAAIHSMLEAHVAILRLDGVATRALADAVLALAEIEREWRGPAATSRLAPALLQMLRGDGEQAGWLASEAAVEGACAQLLAALGDASLPLALLARHLPRQEHVARVGGLSSDATALIQAALARALRPRVEAICAASADARREAA